MESSSALGWPRQIVARLVFLWPLKAFGTMTFMALFFWAYFAVLHNPQTQPFVMPSLWLDDWIGFAPSSFAAYVSLWVYVSLAPALFGTRHALLNFGVWIAWMCAFCLAVFWLFPTVTPPAAIDWNAYPGFAMIKGMDAGGNAFPSLHVASAVFTAFWLNRLFAEVGAPKLLTWLSVLHCLVIVWSTIATRQHVVLDALGGAAVGAAFALLSFRQLRERR